jgi:5-methylcytosine-specific restriction endonuclease McrA
MGWNKDDRAPASQRGYGTVWAGVRKMKLRANPLCEDCADRGVVEKATVVHHIDEDQRNNSPENLRSLSWRCHEKKHGRMKDPAGFGEDGSPLDPRHPWANKGD